MRALVLMSCRLSDEMPYATAAGRVRPHASSHFKRAEEHTMEMLEISDMRQQGFGGNPKKGGGFFFQASFPGSRRENEARIRFE